MTTSKNIARSTGVNPVPRGIRNNNPLNIRKGSSWQGLRDFPTDKSFCEFTSMEYGFRAAFKIMRTYYSKYHLKTLRGIISRWAPPSENDTKRYIAFVQSQAKIASPDTVLPNPWGFDCKVWQEIILAMAWYENGVSFRKYRRTLGLAMNSVINGR